MSKVNVDFEDLIRLKQSLEQNARHFDEIRTQIGQAINSIIGESGEWSDQKSEQFRDVFFTQSDPDIIKLEDTMTQFANYLQGKIAILQQYHSTNLNF